MATAPLTEQEVNELGHALAYESCEAILDGACAQETDLDGEPGYWFNTEVVYELAADDVAKVLKYLSARGLLIRHPRRPNWVQIHDESEATR